MAALLSSTSRAKVDRVALESRAADHADQKPQLEQYFQKRGEDIFVATFIVTQNNQSKAFVSHCSWTETAHSLLRHTDRVAVQRRSTSQIVFVS